MFYLIDFAYVEPKDKFWKSLENKIKKNPDYKSFDLIKQERNYVNRKGRPLQRRDKFIDNVYTPQPSAFRQKLENEIKDIKISNTPEAIKRNEEFKKIMDTKKPKPKNFKLRKTALIGTIGLAGLGTLTYGVNKLRKSRSDKGKTRGKYNG